MGDHPCAAPSERQFVVITTRLLCRSVTMQRRWITSGNDNGGIRHS